MGTRFGRVKGNLFGRAKDSSADIFESIASIPVASPVVLDEPLFIEDCAIGNEGIVWNREVFNEEQVVEAVFRIRGCSGDDDGW